jgi:hypothetical protein
MDRPDNPHGDKTKNQNEISNVTEENRIRLNDWNPFRTFVESGQFDAFLRGELLSTGVLAGPLDISYIRIDSTSPLIILPIYRS